MDEAEFTYPATNEFHRIARAWQSRELELTDFHLHLRGGMTAEKAAIRQERSGIRSGVLENHGHEWPLCDDAALSAFIDDCARAHANGKSMPVGIQVNDRDWFQQIAPEVRARVDYVLADTMIMGVNAEGKPQRLWLPDLVIDDGDEWMERYMAHNLQLLDEPINILANPTYLPASVAEQYDRLWTEERMAQVIEKAVSKDIALEVQAESDFPKPRFLRLAKTMGAKFSFGGNNFTPTPRDLTHWAEAIDLLDLRPADLWTL